MKTWKEVRNNTQSLTEEEKQKIENKIDETLKKFNDLLTKESNPFIEISKSKI